LKSRGVKVGKDTVYEYFDYLVDAFFVHPLKKFSFSRRTENLSTVKVYLGDIGFMNLYSLENYGIRLENIVFLELLRRTHQNPLQKLNYWKSGDDYEVDFVVSEGRKVRKLVQVSLNMQNEMTREREVRGLLAGMRRFELGEGLILTREEEQILKIDGKKIQVLPIWKWLLDLEVV